MCLCIYWHIMNCCKEDLKLNKQQNYITESLELHLFFARIMKEHALFMKVGFMPPCDELAGEAEQFLKQFEELLSRTLALSERVVDKCLLDRGEIVTQFTDCAERQTQCLTGISIDRELTAKALALKGRSGQEPVRVTPELMRQVRLINRDALILTDRLIDYKQRLLCSIQSCNVFNANYPMLIEHILREARLYRAHLMRLMGRCDRTCQELVGGRESFWNRIMMEHALFIRGLLDPSEETLIKTADGFATDYKCLLEMSAAANDQMPRGTNVLELTRKYCDFKKAGVEGIQTCKIRSVILPLLADHVLREANRYLRLLEN